MSVELAESKLLPAERTNRCWPARHQNHQPCKSIREAALQAVLHITLELPLCNHSQLSPPTNRAMSDHRDWRGSLTASERYDNIQRM